MGEISPFVHLGSDIAAPQRPEVRASCASDVLDFISQVPFRPCWNTGKTVYRSVENFPQDWELVRDLNMANFGRVYLYRHLPSDTVMAVKVMGNDAKHTHGTLAVHRGVTTGVLERLLQDDQSEHMVIEIGASYFITYKCKDGAGKRFVLPMLGVWMDDSFLYFATEACVDELFNVVKSESLQRGGDRKSPEELNNRKRSWAYQMFSAVSFLHRNNVAHRDISLENILLHRDGTLRLMDFGMAVPANSRAHGRVGKNFYRPPEMYWKHPYCPKKSDVFMCGMVLFIILTGRPIFTAAVSNDRAYAFIRDRGLEELLEHWKMEYTDPFTLVSRCICHNPADRASVDDILRHPWFDPVPDELKRLVPPVNG
eukprot:GEMP01001528.1.p1 GENE.GEMP01001528.1~~GEMP01001528.1.p1  ORF type:complete len:369 (+),score=56.62 GEMP01001528.1:38-1144(+)